MEVPGKRKRNDDAGGAGCLSGYQSDRLSALPDCLLREIMSHMKARQVVQICVLGRRWRHLWRSMPCLDVDPCDFETPGAERQYVVCESWDRFEDFMDTLLAPGNVSIALLDTLRLHITCCYHHGHDKAASRWIRRALKYHYYHPAQEPSGVQRGALSSTNSWRLRRLQLSNLVLSSQIGVHLSGLFAEHVGTRCQQLEELELKGCRCHFRAITSDSLKSLVLDHCVLYQLSEIATPTLTNLLLDGGTNFDDCLLVITAPALVSMFLGVSLMARKLNGGLSLGPMPSLAKASVRVSSYKELSDQFKMILGSMSNVITNLAISFYPTTKVFGEGSTTFIQFNNLRALELNNCDLSDDFQTLGHFLRNSLKLERLTLRRCKYSNDSKKKKGSSKSKNIAETIPCPNNLVDVQSKNLKLTKIIYRDGGDIYQLIQILQRISGNLPNNYIKLTKVY